jgi:hypothetical protein
MNFICYVIIGLLVLFIFVLIVLLKVTDENKELRAEIERLRRIRSNLGI